MPSDPAPSSSTFPPCDGPQPSLDRATLGRLLARLRPHRRRLALGLALTVVGSVAGVAQPLAARAVLEAVGQGRPLLAFVAALIGLVVLAGVANAFGTLAMEQTAEGVVRDARRTIIGRVLDAPVLLVDRYGGGEVVSRVVSDTTLLRGSAGQALAGLAGGLLTIALSVVVMATIDPVLLATTVGVLAACAATLGLLLPRIARSMTESQEAVGTLATRTEALATHLRTVKASGEEAREQAAIDSLAGDAYRRGVHAARGSAAVMAGGEVAVQVCFLAALGLGGARTATGALSVPDLIAFLLYVMLLIAPITMIAMAAIQLQDSLAAETRLRPLETLPGERRASGAVSRPTTARTRSAPLVVLDGVTVRTEDRVILDRVSLTLPEGGITGIVGASGAGKTTLLELLCGFCDADAGEVVVADRPLASWPLGELRQAIGYVEQEAPIMPGTLAENLRYGAQDSDQRAVRGIIEELGLDRLLAALPEGLETLVGPGGRALSGGERQRVAIARALLRRPRLLLLDEASSQLDAHTERALRGALAVAARHCTVLVVAHRLATVIDADRIVVLDDGRVRAIGKHAELCATDELYRSLAGEQGLTGTVGR